MNMYIQQYPENSLDRFAPIVTRNLIFLNIVIFLAQRVLPGTLGFDITDLLALHYWQASAFELYQMISYMFLHSTQDIFHLLNNMFMLWMFGSVIERFWGSTRYIAFYLATGFTAALTQQVIWSIDLYEVAELGTRLVDLGGGQIMLSSELLNLPTTLGASGAVFGLLLAYGMIFPNAEMFLFFIPIPIKAKYLVFLFGAYELFAGVTSSGSNIAHFAHLGGMIGGIILIYLWRKHGKIQGPYL